MMFNYHICVLRHSSWMVKFSQKLFVTSLPCNVLPLECAITSENERWSTSDTTLVLHSHANTFHPTEYRNPMPAVLQDEAIEKALVAFKISTQPIHTSGSDVPSLTWANVYVPSHPDVLVSTNLHPPYPVYSTLQLQRYHSAQ